MECEYVTSVQTSLMTRYVLGFIGLVVNWPNLTMASSSLEQVLFTGFSYGGLSEIPEEDFYSCSMAATIAGEIGVYGYRPSVLMDMLAGKRAEVGIKIGAYMRTFAGDCSPTDLETALQVG